MRIVPPSQNTANVLCRVGSHDCDTDAFRREGFEHFVDTFKKQNLGNALSHGLAHESCDEGKFPGRQLEVSENLPGTETADCFDFVSFDPFEMKLVCRAIHGLHEPREGVGKGSIEIKDDEFVFRWNAAHVLGSVRVALLGIDAEFFRGLLDKLRVDLLLAEQLDESRESDVTRIHFEEIA